MALEWKPATSTHIDKHGRIVIPAEYRKELGIEPGEKVLMKVVDGRLEIYTYDHATKQLHNLARNVTGNKTGIVDNFIAERRSEWGEEE